MSELLLINPRRVRRRKARKGRMPAGLRRYWASRRAGASRPKRRRRRASRRIASAPVRRRRINPRRRSHRRYVARHVNPRRIHRRRHRNPRMLGGLSVNGILRNTVVPAGIGAIGGLTLDVVYGKLSPMLPATLQTGIPAFAAKVAAAVGLGMVASKAVGRDKATTATVGAVTVLFYGAMKTYLMANVPSLGLSGFQDFVTYSGKPGVGAYMPGMGAYMPRQLGTLNPAPFVSTNVPGSNLGAYESGWQSDGM